MPDWTEHHPYFLTTDTFPETPPPYIRDISTIEKMDLLLGHMVQLRKVETETPWDVRKIKDDALLPNMWEDNIKYQVCYLHDRGIVPCLDYTLEGQTLIPNMTNVSDDRWMNLLGQPIPDIPMVSVDIEIKTENVMPSPDNPVWPIDAIGFWDKDGGTVYTMRPFEDNMTNVTFFTDEAEMILTAVNHMKKYPVILTFNGAQFDLYYLYQRGMALGLRYDELGFERHLVPKAQISDSENHHESPYTQEEIRWVSFKDQVHFDLMLLLRNTTVQNYIYSCYDDKTEVLTRNGFKLLKDIVKDDILATFNPSTEQLEYHHPTAIHKYPFNGKMCSLHGKYIDFSVTPNHELFLYKFNPNKPKPFKDPIRVEAKDLINVPIEQVRRFRRTALWKGKEGPVDVVFRDPVGNEKVVNPICMDDWLWFLGWYVAEGYTTLSQYQIWLAMMGPKDERERMMSFLNKCNLNPSMYNEGLIHFQSKIVVEWLERECGHGAHNKKVPAFIKELPPEKIMLFLDSLIRGDGVIYNGKFKSYFTVSTVLSDDVQELLLKVGLSSTRSLRTDPNPGFVIGVSYTKGFVSSYSRIGEESYKGNVYCVTMPNNLIFVRRNGKTFWCGNSVYKYTGLDDMAKALLGEGKIKIDKTPGMLSTSELIRYNLKDAELVYRIMMRNDRELLRVMVTISRLCKLPLEDICVYRTNKWVQSMLTWEHRKLNILIPNRIQLKEMEAQTEPIIKGKQYKGAKVLDPIRGLWFNVFALDFASLYPTIIARRNLSYETIDCSHKNCQTNSVPETQHWVCMEKKGFHSRIISEIRDLRVDKIKPMAKNDPFWKCVSQGVKTILNATYGVFGYRRFSLYWLPMAECVTAYGRDIIERLAAKVPEFGYTILLGDTDSGFLKPGDKYAPIDDVISWAKDNLDMDLEVDNTYKWLALPGKKKNYLGLTTGGKLIIKGMQSKKIHIPPWINRIFLDLIEYMKVEIEPDKDLPVNGIRERITKGMDDFIQDKLPIEDYVFSMSVKMPPGEYKTESIHGITGKIQKVQKPQHIRALEEEEEGEIEIGTVVRFVKTINGPKMVHAVTLDQLDAGKYVSIYKSSMNQVLDALNLDFYEMSGLPELIEFIPKLYKGGKHKVHKKKVANKDEGKDTVPALCTTPFFVEGGGGSLRGDAPRDVGHDQPETGDAKPPIMVK